MMLSGVRLPSTLHEYGRFDSSPHPRALSLLGFRNLCKKNVADLLAPANVTGTFEHDVVLRDV